MFTGTRRQRLTAAEGKGQDWASLLQFGRNGTSSHADWVFRAVQELRDNEGVERVGVWLDDSQRAEATDGSLTIFRGEVWEQGIGSGPPGWTRLSDDAPLPRELTREGKVCEYDLEGPHAGLIMGPLVGLGHVLWVPITSQHQLRGMVMLGARQKRVALPRRCTQKVAEELGLLLELEETRRQASTRKADLELQRRVQGLLGDGQNANMILSQLAESCTRGDALGGAGAVFALIGERETGLPVACPSGAGNEDQLVIRAQSGETTWAHGVNQGALESFWRHAIEQQRAIGVEADRLPQRKEISRIVAIPLGRGKEISGALLAGLPRRRANLEVLDRLELRAALAAEVLERERRAQAALQQEYWHQALLESSETPVVVINRQGCIRGMSRGARELLGRERAAKDRLPDVLRFAEFFRPRHWERVQQWIDTRTCRKFRDEELTLEAELGAGQGVVLSCFPLSSKQFFAVRLEATKDHKQPASVEDVQEEMRQTIQWLEEGVVVFDQAGTILAHNPRFLQILGMSEKHGDVLHNLEDVIRGAAHNFAAPALFAAEWRTLGQNSETETREELAMERPMPQVIERCTRPIVARSGKKLGHVEVYREITARRLFQSRMLQAEKLASLGQRVTGIMHELSNPITAILGNAQRMILKGEIAKPPVEAHRILEEAERATAILRQLLHFSRETRPERRLVSLNELVEQAVDLQRASLAGSRLMLQVDMAQSLPRLSADAGQLQQVLMNLLQNAQQAIEQTGRGDNIGVRTCLAASGRVRLEVWDDGPGIPEAIQARIFDPFFTTKPEGLGTGLGLAIVSGFVREHGGSISVVCPPEGGTRFLVELPANEELPRADAHSREEEKVGLLSAKQQLGRTNGQGEAPARVPHVLVVEDETTVANLIADVLREEGMQVDVLLDGQSAVEAVRNSAYDLAVCDLKMAGMDGQDFYIELQRVQSPLREHVLFVTGDTIAARTHEFLERNRLGHLAKPFRVEELCEAVRQMLAKSRRTVTDRPSIG